MFGQMMVSIIVFFIGAAITAIPFFVPNKIDVVKTEDDLRKQHKQVIDGIAIIWVGFAIGFIGFINFIVILFEKLAHLVLKIF